MTKRFKKNAILIVGPIGITTIKEFEDVGIRDDYHFICLVPGKTNNIKKEKLLVYFDEVLFVDLKNRSAITKALMPYQDTLIAVTARGDQHIPHLVKVIPHVPYLRTPTEESLMWAVNKVDMRKRFDTLDKSLSPEWYIAQDAEDATIIEIEKRMKYPVIVKPTGLTASLLVTQCYHRDELEAALKKVFKKVSIFNKIYKPIHDGLELPVLVEGYIDGEMYSIDGVVGSRGGVHFYPPVHVKTGKKIGFDDFFGYQQLTPTKLNKKSIQKIERATKQAIKALGLRSSSFHCELKRAEDSEWKIIEIAPRVGGFRSELYKSSFGITPYINDVFIRIPKKVNIDKKDLGYTAVLKIFAKKEGAITSISGHKKISNMASVNKIRQNKHKGDRAVFAKNGGSSVFNIFLHNKDRSELLADIRRIEQTLEIIIN